MPLKRFTRNFKAGWAGLSTAVREIAARTDRSVQSAKLRWNHWEAGRELALAYQRFGRRIAELAISQAISHDAPPRPPSFADDPELIPLAAQIGALRSRIATISQQLAPLHMEESEQPASAARQYVQAAGFTQVVAVVPADSIHCGKSLKEVRRDGEWLALVVIRQGTPFLPTGSTTLTAGDQLVLFGHALACEQAKWSIENSPLIA
jgi:hypothetical protein